MLKIFSRKEKVPTEYPVFNLEITRDKIMTSHLRECDETSRYIGEFIVQNSGRLERGKNIALHTYETILGFCEDHIHFPKGGIVDIATENGELSLKAEFGNSRFTLNGLYSISHAKTSEKSELLIKNIQQFKPDFQFNSIATYENTKIKLLENAYKRYVSSQ